MAVSKETSKWLTLSLALTFASLSAATAISVYFWRKRPGHLTDKVRELELSLKASLEKCAAERQGRVRAQRALRKGLTQPKPDNLEFANFPMIPIGTVRSCYSTRNGTPRQPLLVPLARASLVFDSTRVPLASLEGLEGYSHCWIIYVFHLNTNLEKLWKHPSQSEFKAKVRVPRLKGGRMGVFATRSPHRLCPIGLTVAKVETVRGHTVQISGIDLVDGTPVLDVKPYLPYCDSIQAATVPEWIKEDKLLAVASVKFSEGFSISLADCWGSVGKRSLYESPDEFQGLVKQVLSWDIRSVSQRSRPHNSLINSEVGRITKSIDSNDYLDEESLGNEGEHVSVVSSDIIYHLILEGLDVSYRIDSEGSILVEKASLSSHI